MSLITPDSRANVGKVAAALLRAAGGDATKVRTRTDRGAVYFDVDDDVAQAYASATDTPPKPRKRAAPKAAAPPQD